MAITISHEAVELIRHSLELGGHDPAVVGVRLRMAGGAVRPRFAPGPEEGDTVLEAGGVRVFVAGAILDGHPDGVLTVSDEHDQLIIR